MIFRMNCNVKKKLGRECLKIVDNLENIGFGGLLKIKLRSE